MIIVKISSKYQITIPALVREVLGLNVGDRLYSSNDQGQLLVCRERPQLDEQFVPVTIRDRFQLTLPVKKLRIRSYFSDSAAVVEQNGLEGFSVRPLPSVEPNLMDHRARAPNEPDLNIGREYPSTLKKLT